MKTVEDFVEQLVKVEYVEQSECYGLYPFQLFCETKEGKLEMNSLALGGDVISCYKRVKKYLDLESPKIFLALDFPKGGDLIHDFVGVYSVMNGEPSLFAIPYNHITGETYERVYESNQLTIIFEQFKQHIK